MPANDNATLPDAKVLLEIEHLKKQVRWFWLTPAAIAIPAFLAIATIWQGRITQSRQHAFEQDQADIAFLEQRLGKLYVPVSMHLGIVKGFYDRYPAAGVEERRLLEAEWREHNRSLSTIVTEWSAYVSPAKGQTVQCVEQTISQLLTHLAQWDVVFRLKHEAKVYDGPVYAGIAEFGYQGFPRGECGADSVFVRGLRELRQQLHTARSVSYPT